MTQSWWVYLLVCRDGRTYAGIATDVAARFASHSSGKGAKFTRSNPPIRVLGAQAFASKSEALKAEAALKTLNRTAKVAWASERPLAHSVIVKGVQRDGLWTTPYDAPHPGHPLRRRRSSRRICSYPTT